MWLRSEVVYQIILYQQLPAEYAIESTLSIEIIYINEIVLVSWEVGISQSSTIDSSFRAYNLASNVLDSTPSLTHPQLSQEPTCLNVYY